MTWRQKAISEKVIIIEQSDRNETFILLSLKKEAQISEISSVVTNGRSLINFVD